jgi:hypothetical protein
MRFLMPLALALTVACADVPTADQVVSPPAVEAPAPTSTEAVVTEAAPNDVAPAVPTAMEGSWSFELSSTQQARLTVLNMALADAAPTASELAAVKLDGTAANDMDTLLLLRKSDANAPEIDSARNELKMLQQHTWQLKDGLLSLMVDDGAQEGYAIQVIEATDSKITVKLADSLGSIEDASIELVSADKLVVHRSDGDLVLTR